LKAYKIYLNVIDTSWNYKFVMMDPTMLILWCEIKNVPTLLAYQPQICKRKWLW